MYPLYTLCTFLGTLQVATGVFDTSYYKILVDQTRGNFSYWDIKCRDLGDRWAPAIIDTEEEGIVLEFGVSDQDKRLSHWIGGSTNRGVNKTMRMRHYIPDYTGRRNVRVKLGDGDGISFNAAEPSELDTRVICEKTPLNRLGEQGESEGLQFSSTTRKYQLIDRLTYLCTDLNENSYKPWKLVSQETEEEFNFIRSGMGFFPAHYHGKYLHHGRSLVEPSAGAFGYSDYIPTDRFVETDKRYFVYIGPSTEEEDLPENAKYNASDEKFFSFNQFNITGFPIDAGKICEREVNISAINLCEGFKFASHQSYYSRLTAASSHNYAYWSLRCEGLGEGWRPATFESEGEIVFIREAQRGFSDSRDYWVDGFTGSEMGSTVQFSAYFTTLSDPNTVIVSPCNGRECNFELISAPPSKRTHGILCEKAVIHFGLELASTTSRYRKLFVGHELNTKTFGCWAHRCSEIGSGWKPAVLNTVDEFNFIRIGQKSFINSDSFWLSGSTNFNGTIEFSDYIDNNSGQNGVMVSTQRSGTIGTVTTDFNDKNTFILKAQSHDIGLDGILCEKEVDTCDVEFASATSYYKSIVGSANTYSYYTSKCRELGDGWGATVIECEEEFDFIQQSLINDQDLDHFVDGSYYNEAFYIGLPLPFQAYSPRQTERPLYMVWENLTNIASETVRKP